MDGKPPGGPGGAGRRPMLIKQENIMGSPDGYPGNMGVCSSGSSIFSIFFSHPSLRPSLTIIRVCVIQFRSLTIFEFVVSYYQTTFKL